MAKQALFHDETSRLHILANDSLILFAYTHHAMKEMRKDQLVKQDVEYVLRRGVVQKVELNRGEETWNVVGSDTDERLLQIVIVPYEREIEIKVITTWQEKR